MPKTKSPDTPTTTPETKLTEGLFREIHVAQAAQKSARLRYTQVCQASLPEPPGTPLGSNEPGHNQRHIRDLLCAIDLAGRLNNSQSPTPGHTSGPAIWPNSHTIRFTYRRRRAECSPPSQCARSTAISVTRHLTTMRGRKMTSPLPERWPKLHDSNGLRRVEPRCPKLNLPRGKGN